MVVPKNSFPRGEPIATTDSPTNNSSELPKTTVAGTVTVESVIFSNAISFASS